MNDGSDQKRVRKQIRMFVQWKVDGRKKRWKTNGWKKRPMEKPGKEGLGGGGKSWSGAPHFLQPCSPPSPFARRLLRICINSSKSSILVQRIFPTSITSSKAKAWERVWSSSLLTDITILRDSRTSASTSSVDCVAMVSKPSMTFGRNGVRISVLCDILRWAQNLQWSIQKYHHSYSFQRNPFMQ